MCSQGAGEKAGRTLLLETRGGIIPDVKSFPVSRGVINCGVRARVVFSSWVRFPVDSK